MYVFCHAALSLAHTVKIKKTPCAPPPAIPTTQPSTHYPVQILVVDMAARAPPSSSPMPSSTQSPGGAAAKGPRVVRSFTWEGGGASMAAAARGEQQEQE